MTVYIEDLIECLNDSRVKLNSYDLQVTNSFNAQLFTGVGLTEKQAVLAIKIISKYKTQLEPIVGQSIDAFIKNPVYRHPLRTIASARSIEIVTNSEGRKEIKAKFPYDENIISEIRKLPIMSGSRRWNKEAGSWFFDLTEDHISFLIRTFADKLCEYDNEFQNYVSQASAIINNIENYAPVLTQDLTVKNAPKNLPKITATNIIDALFQARRMGVTLWDDVINHYLDHEYNNPIVVDFLRNEITKDFDILNDANSIEFLELLVKNLSPTMIVIPGGSELQKTRLAYNLLKGMALEEKNFSVLFRLSNENGKNFNEFVKNHQLNSPISSETRVVFVSNKMPKTVAKSGIHINSIINLGFTSAHYSLRHYMKDYQNIINFNPVTPVELGQGKINV